ncbi:MAG TPA: TetR/AcrR family transcriptional regulator [Longimicrobium sp.]|nr:TetR/AcrR family transcriptional regulator [Longimicrobium sp.]
MRTAQVPSRKPSSTAAPYHHGNLRQALIDAALAAEADVGIGGLTLREVARRVGVSHAAAYRHFAGRDALVRAAADQGFARLNDVLAAVPVEHWQPLARFHMLASEYVRFALRERPHFRLMFALQPTAGVPGAEPDERMAAVRGHFTAAVEAAVGAGLLREGNAERMGAVAWAQVHGLATLALAGGLTDAGEMTEPEYVKWAAKLAVVAVTGAIFGSRPPGVPAVWTEG